MINLNKHIKIFAISSTLLLFYPVVKCEKIQNNSSISNSSFYNQNSTSKKPSSLVKRTSSGNIDYIPKLRTQAQVRNELIKNAFTSIANGFMNLFKFITKK